MDFNFDLMNNAKTEEEVRLAFLSVTRDIFTTKGLDSERREKYRIYSERILEENMKRFK